MYCFNAVSPWQCVLQAPGISGKLLKFHFLSQLYQPCKQFLCRGGSRILVTGVQSVLIPAIFWGIYPRIPNSHSRKTPKTQENASNLPHPPDMWFPRSTKSRINTRSNIWGRNPNWGREACEDWWRSPRKGGKPLARKFLRFKLKMVQVGVYLERHSFI